MPGYSYYGYRWYRYIHTIHFCHTMVSHLCMFSPGFLWWLGCRVTTCTPQRFRLGHLSSSFGATVPEWGHTFTIAFKGTRWCWRSTQRMSHTWLWREAPRVSCPKLIWFSLMVQDSREPQDLFRWCSLTTIIEILMSWLSTPCRMCQGWVERIQWRDFQMFSVSVKTACGHPQHVVKRTAITH